MNGAAVDLGRRGFLRGRSPARARRWSQDDAIGNATNGVLWDVAMESARHILVVGDDGCILHHCDGEWRREDASTGLPLHAVCFDGTGGAVAVGWLGCICEYRDMAWTQVQGAQPAGADTGTSARTQVPLFDVCVGGDDRVWAVGDHGRIVYRELGSWRESDSGVTGNLRAVTTLRDGQVLAAGAGGVCVVGDGEDWQRSATGTDATIMGFAHSERERIVAVGARYDGAAGRFRGVLLEFDGEHWSTIELPPDVGRLRGVAREDDGLLLVGDGGAAWRWHRHACKRIDVDTQHDLYAVASVGNGDACIVGDFGTALRPSQHRCPSKRAATRVERGAWRTVDAVPATETLWGIWGDDKGWLVAVGDAGAALTFDGMQWRRHALPCSHRLAAVWGTSRRNVYTVGEGGTIVHFDGTGWTRMATPGIGEALVAITGFGPHDAFAVGDGGVILRFDGVAWRRQSSGTNEALYDVWGIDGNHVLAVGDAGAVMRWNGRRWDGFQVGTDSAIYGAWGTALDNIFLVGPSGTGLHYDGTRWCRERVPLRADLLAVAGTRDGCPLAVGTLGATVLRDDRQWRADDADGEINFRGVWVGNDGRAYAVGDNGVIALCDFAPQGFRYGVRARGPCPRR